MVAALLTVAFNNGVDTPMRVCLCCACLNITLPNLLTSCNSSCYCVIHYVGAFNHCRSQQGLSSEGYFTSPTEHQANEPLQKLPNLLEQLQLSPEGPAQVTDTAKNVFA
jgi:hypothetical protein